MGLKRHFKADGQSRLVGVWETPFYSLQVGYKYTLHMECLILYNGSTLNSDFICWPTTETSKEPIKRRYSVLMSN